MSFFLGEIVYGLKSPGDGRSSWLGLGSERTRTSLPISSKITGGLLQDEKYAVRREPGPIREWAETLTRLG